MILLCMLGWVWGADFDFQPADHCVAWKARKKILRGDLKFLGKSHPVTFEVTVPVAGRMQGLCKTTFSALGVEPPAVLGGIAAQVQDELELGFQFQKSKISGSSAE